MSTRTSPCFGASRSTSSTGSRGPGSCSTAAFMCSSYSIVLRAASMTFSFDGMKSGSSFRLYGTDA